jgi:NAD dependent epimerase/dehydratase family
VVVQRHVGVIGGSGFVGRHVIERLQKSGIDVCNIDIVPSPDPHTTNYIADLRDLPSLTSALQGCDTVIFLAAQWRDDVRPESLYYDVNVGGAANFAHAARTLGIKRCIFTSSVSIYGPTEFEVEEDHPPGAINHYGKSKLEAEQEMVGFRPGRLFDDHKAHSHFRTGKSRQRLESFEPDYQRPVPHDWQWNKQEVRCLRPQYRSIYRIAVRFYGGYTHL